MTIPVEHSFLRANIDRALVLTHHDLAGFQHPMGVRCAYMESPKLLEATVGNLLVCCMGYGGGAEERPTYTCYSYLGGDPRAAARACRMLYEACDPSQRSLMVELIEEVLKQHTRFELQVRLGTRERTGYDLPLSRSNRFGAAVLGLADAFGVAALELVEPA